VNDAIIRMDDTTQQNTALVEQAAAAAESLMEQADELMSTVSIFSIEGTQHVHRHTAAKVTSAIHSKPSSVASQPAPMKSYAKTGTDDAEWAEF
jgi:methyl-accepting chemotaxis protein